ncbi:hypothetical protein PVL29_022823 [Vitis rotundifolia]|uniref:DYW domain-containing protein n=1 Tax=Vitis rotundifolia TaxID=103349 RepID=A0AA39DAN4_VITRO|nr:hypothetical protein PVL29_022823 [Vitis rotundifolia]
MKPMLDQGSLVAAIKRCTRVGDLKAIQAHMVRANLTQDTFLTSHVAYAQRIFSCTHHPNLFMWNTIIRGYSISDSPITAIALYRDMYLCGISPNSYTFGFVLKACCKLLRLCEGQELQSRIMKVGLDFETPLLNGLIKLYAACGCMDYACVMFDEMPEQDSASWSTMALKLFREMQAENVSSDAFTLASVVGVCGDLGALDLGKWVHSYIDKEGVKIDVVLGTALVGMCSKCGSLDNALKVFQGMAERDVTAWSTMIAGYAIHGHCEKALQLFDAMKRSKTIPNCVTFTSVLSACSHSGLIEKGHQIFETMWTEYKIAPQIKHYGCMVDLFCRAGMVGHAHKFIQTMPIEPNVVLWRTLLGACKTHGYKDLGEHISRKILKLDPSSPENYVLVSNVYASQGRWSSVCQVRRLMKDKAPKKQHGWSSIEINFMVHKFIMGDESHPEREKIYGMLHQMARKLKQVGHVASTVDVLHDIDEEEKEYALGLHSERLAIAYGLLHTPNGSPIRIVKNLRICRDCHEVIKLISEVYNREIILRDRVRFHRFRERGCSCNDYW